MNDDKRYLKRRRQGWYLAVDVPKELRATVGKVKIVLSLKTRDLKVAQARRWSALEHIKRTVEAARWELSARRQLYREAFRAALKELRELPPDDHSQEDPDEPWNSLPTTTDALADEAERLDERGDHGPRYQALLIALRERQGRPADIPERYLMTFSEAAREYLAEQRRDPYAGLTEQTVGQAEAVYRLFADHAGDPRAVKVDREMITGFLDQVARLSPTWGRSPATKKRTLDELLVLYGGGPEGLSNKTLNRYTQALRSVWSWAKARGHVTREDPFPGLNRKIAHHRKTGWVPFTDEELRVLLGAMQPAVRPRPHSVETALSWITWIAAFSGMRLNEVCS